ncbi:unnamed protein product [Polarella glacialis]|uniref:Acyltransferase n=1 Tax=Polarella glacialis TaxID=89957 RepID=A0A813G167_POLGL|nr:unnamed protein product [Polarella glacialis]
MLDLINFRRRSAKQALSTSSGEPSVIKVRMEIARIRRLALQVDRCGFGASQPLESSTASAQENGTGDLDALVARRRTDGRSFLKGLLAHLIFLPCWTLPPLLLFGGVLTAVAPLGSVLGAQVALACGLGMCTSLTVSPRNVPLRTALCALLALMAGLAKTRRGLLRSAAATSVVAWLTWTVTVESKFSKLPKLMNFIFDWAKDFYAMAELRGNLQDMHQGRSFFAFHPHGVLSIGWTINGMFNKDFMRHAGKVTWLVAPQLRNQDPIFRCLCDGYESDDRAIEGGDTQGFKKFMAEGGSVAFIPGGFRDLATHRFGKDCTVVQNRKGFVKYCLQFGYRLHPVYTFGESETYHTFAGLRKLRMWIAGHNVPMVLFFGFPLLPILPRPQSRLLTYVGPGIDLPHLPNPCQEDVDLWHGVYLQALSQLFTDKRAEAGFPEAELEIL